MSVRLDVDIAKGRPTKWAFARLNEPVILGMGGVEIVVWDKWGRKRRGTLVVSVGGVRWFAYKAERAARMRAGHDSVA